MRSAATPYGQGRASNRSYRARPLRDFRPIPTAGPNATPRLPVEGDGQGVHDGRPIIRESLPRKKIHMGSWSVHLAFRSSAEAGTLLPTAVRTSWAGPGWTLLEDQFGEYEAFDGALGDLPGHVLFATVIDGDFAHVKGYLDTTPQWSVFLNEKAAAAFWAAHADVPEDDRSGTDAPDLSSPGAEDDALHGRIQKWAAGAGTTVDRAELRRVLAAEHVFAEHGLLAFTRLLGIAPAETASRPPAPDA
jgi:hypothetical protein